MEKRLQAIVHHTSRLALEIICDWHFGNGLKCAMHALSSESSPGHVRRKNWASVWPVPKQARLEVGVLLWRELGDGDWWEVGYYRIRGSS